MVPPRRTSFPPDEGPGPIEPPYPTTEDGFEGTGLRTIAKAVIVVVAIVVVIALAVASQPQPSPAGASVAHCSVAINASATSGPAPFTATFTAEVTVPPGVTSGEPMWQFGPFPPGFDLNYTYGSTVTHTWGTNGSYGVHVSVPDSTGQGCYTTMSVDVT